MPTRSRVIINSTQPFQSYSTSTFVELNSLINGSQSKAHDDFNIHDQIDWFVVRINLVLMMFGIVGNLICISVLSQKPLLKRKFNWLDNTNQVLG